MDNSYLYITGSSHVFKLVVWIGVMQKNTISSLLSLQSSSLGLLNLHGPSFVYLLYNVLYILYDPKCSNLPHVVIPETVKRMSIRWREKWEIILTSLDGKIHYCTYWFESVCSCVHRPYFPVFCEVSSGIKPKSLEYKVCIKRRRRWRHFNTSY